MVSNPVVYSIVDVMSTNGVSVVIISSMSVKLNSMVLYMAVVVSGRGVEGVEVVGFCVVGTDVEG